jgi:hypothetical protein
MMSRKSVSVLVILVVAISLVALPAQVCATKPEDVVLTMDLDITGPGSAEGTFTATGAINDSGSVYEVFRWTDEGSLQGTMVLTGADGTITLRFNLSVTATGTEGHIVIKSGTGAYEYIHGVGTGGALVDPVAATIDAEFYGQVHIDP